MGGGVPQKGGGARGPRVSAGNLRREGGGGLNVFFSGPKLNYQLVKFFSSLQGAAIRPPKSGIFGASLAIFFACGVFFMLCKGSSSLTTRTPSIKGPKCPPR